MDGISGMEGHGPGQGTPYRTEVLIGSTNPLALDLIASTIAGYDPKEIPTNRIAMARGIWLKSPEEINYDGPDLDSVIRKDFKRITVTHDSNISLKFLKNRIHFLRKFDRRPVFIHNNCTGCTDCIRICPQNAIVMDGARKNYVVLTDSKCIRCFCCSEVCKFDAVMIRFKVFGV
jgi:ferredoxin